MTTLLLLACLQDEAPLEVFYKEGLRFRAAEAELYLSGFFRAHYRTVFDRPDDDDAPRRSVPDSAFLRQGRLDLGGTFARDWGFRVLTDFATGTYNQPSGAGPSSTGAVLRDAWLEWKRHPEFVVRAGQFFEPCTSEELMSGRWMEFADRGAPLRLMPGRELGIEAYGTLADGVLTYYVMLAQGGGLVNDQGRSVNDANDEKELGGLVYVRPVPGLRFGAGASVTDVDDVPGTGFDLVTTELSLLWLDSTAGVFDGRRRRLDVSFLAYRGPLSLRAEYLWRRDELADPAPEDELRSDGGWISASWLVTGEEKRPDLRPIPLSGWGALEASLRVARVRVSNAFEAGLAGSGGNAERLRAWSAALTWWHGRFLRLTAEFVREEFDEPLAFDTRSEDALSGLLFRLQIDF
jgi:phosphate-selective porin